MRSPFGTPFCGTGAVVVLAPKGTSVPPRPEGDDGGAGRPEVVARMLKLRRFRWAFHALHCTLVVVETELADKDARLESRDGATRLA
jgi:hypothetical protein